MVEFEEADRLPGLPPTAGWHDSRGGYRRPVLADALASGGPFRPGRAVEIVSGTGLLTPPIGEVWPEVIEWTCPAACWRARPRGAGSRPMPPG